LKFDQHVVWGTGRGVEEEGEMDHGHGYVVVDRQALLQVLCDILDKGCHAPGSPALFRVAAEGLEKGLANHFIFWHCDMAPVVSWLANKLDSGEWGWGCGHGSARRPGHSFEDIAASGSAHSSPPRVARGSFPTNSQVIYIHIYIYGFGRRYGPGNIYIYIYIYI
jgi:hypothetical protein